MYEKNIVGVREGGGVNRLKKGAWIVCRFKRRPGKKLANKRSHVFEVGRG